MVYSHYMIVSMYANISKANKKLILYKKGGKRKGETGTHEAESKTERALKRA